MSESTLFPAPILKPPPPETKWQREYQAFLRLLPQLLQTHPGKYVAIHEGNLVDSGEDKIALALRVYERFGYQPIYVGLVAERPPAPTPVRRSDV